MATYANITNQVAALKELYSDDSWVLKNLVYEKQPFLALVPKDESVDGLGGKYFPVPTIYGTNQGRSATFTNAQNNQTPTQDVSYLVTTVSNYSIATITNQLLEATKTNAAAFIDQGKLQMDGAFRSITNDLAADLFRSGTGSRGQIASNGYSATGGTPNTVTMTLSNPNDIVQFEVGMTLVAMSTDGGAPTTDTVAVTNVNRVTGVIIGTGSTSSLDAKFANGAFLGVQGDVASAGSTTTSTALKITGLAGWLPITDPAPGSSFFGVDRSVDRTRLAGVPYDGRNASVEEALINSSSLLAREGGYPDYCFMNFSSWAALEKELGSKVQYVQVKHDMADVAFKGITVNAPYGPITVVADRNSQAQTAYLLSLNTWKLRSTNRAPHILTYGMEGLEGLRVSNSDALEIRVGYYANLTCCAPGWNSVVQLSA